MTKKVFSVYDEKAEAFLQPFFVDTNGLAIRSISECLTDPNHMFSKHSSDFSLFLLGEFDDSTGIMTADKKSLGSLVEFKPQIQED